MSIPLYLQIIAGMMTEGMTADRQAHQRIHDHLAGVMDDAVAAKHGQESARLVTAAALSEEGRAIAQKHAVRLSAAHDEAASQLGLECAECYKEALGLPLDSDQDNDGIPDDQDPSDQEDDGSESARSQKGKKIMTEAEMLAALKAKGYQVEAPKTVEEQLAELRALSETQSRELAALKESRATGPAPQRQTQAPSAMNETSSLQLEPLYEEGDYLAGTLKPANWRALANRRVPWPQDIDPEMALHELAPFLAFRLLDQEAAAMGRDLTTYIDTHERV